MQRRVFLRKSLQGIAMLTASQPAFGISWNDYRRIRGKGLTLRFAIASDGHYGQPDTPFEKFHDEMMNWLNQEHTRHALNFTLFNGDLIHDDPVFLPAVKAKYDRLAMPYYVSRGNHDRCDENTWKKTWATDLNYSFVIGDNSFVVLDTSNINGDYLCPEPDQVEEMLREHKGQKNVFVFMHITPVKWTGAGISCRKIVRTFSRYKNLKAIFHGHDHDEDYVKTISGKSYFFDSHLGGNWGTDYRGYRVVEIAESEILTYQINPSEGKRVNSGGLHVQSR